MNKFWLPVGMAPATATSPVAAITQQGVMAAYSNGAYKVFFKLYPNLSPGPTMQHEWDRAQQRE